MGTGLVVLAVGVLLCFFGIRSVNLALLASGFGLGYCLATTPPDTPERLGICRLLAQDDPRWIDTIAMSRDQEGR